MSKQARRRRGIAVFIVVALFMALGVDIPPAAATGSLTAVSATAYSAFTGQTNTKYSWNFTTATTATLASASTTLQSGTDVANHYLALNATSGNYASTPDSVANSVTGDLDIRAEVAPVSWTPTPSKALVSKWNTKESYRLSINTSGDLMLEWSSDGSTTNGTASTVATGFSAGSSHWVRATLQVNDGSGHNVVTYYTSSDGSTWTQLGSTITNSGTTSIYDSTDAVEVGSYGAGTGYSYNGKIYYAEVRSGIGGTVENSFDPARDTPTAPSSWTASTGETWTVNRSGTNFPADIAGDLTINSVIGLPNTGTATMRLIDAVAAYQFTATSVPAGTASNLTFTGFTNSMTPGSTSTSITTYDSTHIAVDTGTIAGNFRLFTPPTSDLTSTSVSATSTVASATNVNYTITASSVTLSAIKCVAAVFMTTNDHNGSTPTGLAFPGTTFDSASTLILSASSWTTTRSPAPGILQDTYVTGTTPASSSSRTLVLDGVTNPSSAGTYYINLITYGNVNCSSTPLDGAVIPFTVEANLSPNTAGSLGQNNGGTSIPTGNWIGVSSVTFTGNVSDQNTADTDSLCVEAEPVGTSFTNTQTACGTGVAYAGSSVPATVTLSGLSTNTQYHWQARVKDAGGLYSSWTSYGGNAESAADFGVDTSPPITGTVYDGSIAGVESSYNNGSLSALSCNWSGFSDAGSGLASYDYSLGSSAGATDLVGWTNVSPSTTSATASSLTLHTGQTYFCNVRANDSLGNQSSVVSSTGQAVAPTLTFVVSASVINFNSLGPADSYTDTESLTLTTSTNAYHGYTINAYETGPPSSGSASIADYSSPASSPTAWTGTGFGYNVSGGAAVAGFSGSKYAHFGPSTSPDSPIVHSGSVTGTPISGEVETVTFKVAASASQSAGTYRTSIVWSCVPSF